MKILFLLLFLVGCGDPTVQEGSSDLLVYRDEKNKVTCYRVVMFEGLSCLKD